MWAACWAVLALAATRAQECEHQPVVLAWHAPAGAAAAALLRRALLAANHAPACVRLQHWPAANATALCKRLRKPAPREHALVAVAVEHEHKRQNCSLRWVGAEPAQLRVLAPGAAPLSPRLLARLGTGAPNHCKELLLKGTLPPAPALRGCGFHATEGNVVLIPRDEWPRAHAALSRAGLRARAVSRAELAGPPAGGSQLLVDALWDEGTLELPLWLQPDVTAWLMADEEQLLRHLPTLYLLLEGARFQPTAAHLLAVLRQPAALRDPPDYEAAAEATPVQDVKVWSDTLKKLRKQRAVALLCEDDPPYFVEVVKGAVAQYAFSQTDRLRPSGPRLVIEMTPMRVNCSETAALVDLVNKWRATGEMWGMVGVAAPAELVEPAVRHALAERLPLLAYSAGAASVRSATCSPERQARQLSLLLTECGWRRVALLTDASATALRLARALAADQSELELQEATAREPAAAVGELAAMDARVFVVLGSARTAWRVLQAAHAQGLVAARGYVWLLSALDPPADAALLAAVAPLVVSCAARGGTVVGELAKGLRKEVAPPWPARLAALADALTTLAVGHMLLVRRYNTFEFHDKADKLRDFWTEVQQSPVAGVAGNLTYDNSSVGDAPVYVELWPGPDGAAGVPAVYLPADCPLHPPPSDGTPSCMWRAGRSFEQRCHDSELAGALVALVVVVVLGAACRRWLRRRDVRLRREATVRVLAMREAAFADLLPFLVEPTALRLGGELGAGHYGRVRQGELRAPRRPPVQVAVKALREGASPAEESEFLREGRTLAGLRHERVVRFEGVCWDGGPPLLLMEYAFFGDLAAYLRARRHLANEAGTGEGEHVAAPALTRLAREAAEALQYLAEQRLVHRDVRAANCLVDARRSLKLADFGLARHTGDAADEYVCCGCAFFPVLWMAPESLRGVASPASDVWAFGVLALELQTLGARPWGAAPPAAVVRAVLRGAKPPLPRGANAESRALAAACWRRDAARRPSAARLARWLARRPRALRPLPQPYAPEPDCDSGIGEPDQDAPR